MKLLFSFVFLFFISFQAQAQAMVLINYYNNSSNRNEFDWDAFPKKNILQKHIEYINHRINHFDWEAFTNKETLQKHIDDRNQMFNIYPAGVPATIYLDNIYLVRIEQELKLYDMGIKKGLSPEMIQVAKKAIALHWENLNSKENQAKTYVGLGGFADVSIMEQKNREKKYYYDGIWDLYTADYEIVFNMVKKGDKHLFKALGSNDEFYVKFITPYVKIFLERITNTTQAYYNSLGGELDYETFRRTGYGYKEGPYHIKRLFKELNVINLTDMYLNSLKIYKSFVENFKTPIGEHQKELMRVIKDWHTNQAFLAVDGWIDSYKIYGVTLSHVIVAARLRKFYEAPPEVKQKIAIFLRNDIFYNKIFTNTDDKNKFRARVNALIGLHALGVATVEEEKLYNQAVEQGIITPNVTRVNSYAARSVPLPDVTNKAKEQNVITEKPTHSGSDLSFLNTAS